MIHFVIYEQIKAHLAEAKGRQPDDDKSYAEFLEFMMASATSKTVATCCAYPHGE